MLRQLRPKFGLKPEPNRIRAELGHIWTRQTQAASGSSKIGKSWPKPVQVGSREGLRPNLSWKGLKPTRMNLLTLFMIWKRIKGKALLQPVWFLSILNRIHWFTVLLVCFNITVVTGQYHKRAPEFQNKKFISIGNYVHRKPVFAVPHVEEKFALFNYSAHQVNIEKRSRRDLYEGSKLLDAHRKQVNNTPLIFHLIHMVTNNLNSKHMIYEGKKCLINLTDSYLHRDIFSNLQTID